MKYIRRFFGSFTLTIFSDDLSKNVNTLRIPRILIPISILVAFIPVIFIMHFVKSYYDNTQVVVAEQLRNEALETELANQIDKAMKLESEVSVLEKETSHLEEKTSEVQGKLSELNILETELREYLSELPVDLSGQGGIDVEPTDEEIALFNQQERDVTEQSAELLLRYENILSNVISTKEQMEYVPTIWPANSSYVTSAFGVRSDPFNKNASSHTGIDIRGNWGDPVYASASGRVMYANYSGGYGNVIKLNHAGEYVTVYGHLMTILVKNNEVVEKGDIIGYIGSTGRSTGPHLHFEIIENGKNIDPKAFLKQFAS